MKNKDKDIVIAIYVSEYNFLHVNLFSIQDFNKGKYPEDKAGSLFKDGDKEVVAIVFKPEDFFSYSSGIPRIYLGEIYFTFSYKFEVQKFIACFRDNFLMDLKELVNEIKKQFPNAKVLISGGEV